MRFWGMSMLVTGLLTVAAPGAFAQPGERLGQASALDKQLPPGGSHTYTVRLAAGESATVIVTQMGVDVVVELSGPDGKLIDSVDSPNGRNGDEPVEILARQAGDYLLRVRSIDAREPEGRYRIAVTEWRDTSQTSRLLQTRALAREEATRWLRPFSVTLPAIESIVSDTPLPPLDALADESACSASGRQPTGAGSLAICGWRSRNA